MVYLIKEESAQIGGAKRFEYPGLNNHKWFSLNFFVLCLVTWFNFSASSGDVQLLGIQSLDISLPSLLLLLKSKIPCPAQLHLTQPGATIHDDSTSTSHPSHILTKDPCLNLLSFSQPQSLLVSSFLCFTLGVLSVLYTILTRGLYLLLTSFMSLTLEHSMSETISPRMLWLLVSPTLEYSVIQCNQSSLIVKSLFHMPTLQHGAVAVVPHLLVLIQLNPSSYISNFVIPVIILIHNFVDPSCIIYYGSHHICTVLLSKENAEFWH